MSVDKYRFAVTFVASNLLIAGFLAGIASGGVAMAVPTAGVGGFTITFDELDGNGFQQYATLENNTACKQYPSAVAQIDSGTIKGLKMYKDVEIPDGMPGGGDTVRMEITSSEEVKFSGLTQKFTHLRGDLVFDDGQSIDQNADPDAASRFGISAPGIKIKNGEINVQSQFMNSITLNGATVQTKVNPESNVSFPEADCAAVNSSQA